MALSVSACIYPNNAAYVLRRPTDVLFTTSSSCYSYCVHTPSSSFDTKPDPIVFTCTMAQYHHPPPLQRRPASRLALGATPPRAPPARSYPLSSSVSPPPAGVRSVAKHVVCVTRMVVNSTLSLSKMIYCNALTNELGSAAKAYWLLRCCQPRLGPIPRLGFDTSSGPKRGLAACCPPYLRRVLLVLHRTGWAVRRKPT